MVFLGSVFPSGPTENKSVRSETVKREREGES